MTDFICLIIQFVDSSVLIGAIVTWVLFCTSFDVYHQVKLYFNPELQVDSEEILEAKVSIAGQNVIKPKAKAAPNKSSLEKFIIGCSFYSNATQIFRTDNQGKITCLNGIRLFSMLWIVFAHAFYYAADRFQFLKMGRQISNIDTCGERSNK